MAEKETVRSLLSEVAGRSALGSRWGYVLLRSPLPVSVTGQQQAPGWHMDWEIPSAEGPRLTAGRGLIVRVSCLFCLSS